MKQRQVRDVEGEGVLSEVGDAEDGSHEYLIVVPGAKMRDSGKGPGFGAAHLPGHPCGPTDRWLPLQLGF